jgi:hypothetical protein
VPLGHRFLFTATAALLVAGVSTGLTASAARAQAQTPASACNDANDIAVLPAPFSPWKGAPLQVLFTVEKPLDGTLSLIAPDGKVAATSADRMGGPPYFWYAEVAAPAAGTWHATVTPQGASGCSPISRDIAVRDTPQPAHAISGTWPLRNSWNRATENLYSAWIEKMFDAPLDAEPSWKALHEVLRDRSRNMLFDYFGLREDDNLILRPDCAKLPYLLRAYFASKMGLPFGYSHCTRGNLGKPPRCSSWFNTEHPEVSRPTPQPEPVSAPAPEEPKPAPNLLQKMFSGPAAEPAPAPADEPAESAATTPAPATKHVGPARSFAEYLQTVGDAVQSGNGRTLAIDSNTDFYPVALNQNALRPGTIYADPYGHVMMLVRRVPQTANAAGMFFTVDAEPDYTVARKRFWRGGFLFVNDPALGNPGFKRFRPIVREANGSLRRLTNAEIAKDPQYGDFSLEQSKLGVEDFYDRMDDVASPQPLDPVRALKDVIDSLEEQVKVRVGSVDFGRKFLDKSAAAAGMPDGAAIFQTSGAWEDFATPARDFRLLIAIDVVRNFPDRVARRPDRYAIPQGQSIADVKAQLQSVLASELASRKFSYTRSDGSSWTLALKDVVDRAPAFEMGYNLNDCVELRWGAPENSQEASTCKRHAPQTQRTKMIKYRVWFHDRHWPARA